MFLCSSSCPLDRIRATSSTSRRRQHPSRRLRLNLPVTYSPAPPRTSPACWHRRWAWPSPCSASRRHSLPVADPARRRAGAPILTSSYAAPDRLGYGHATIIETNAPVVSAMLKRAQVFPWGLFRIRPLPAARVWKSPTLATTSPSPSTLKTSGKGGIGFPSTSKVPVRPLRIFPAPLLKSTKTPAVALELRD